MSAGRFVVIEGLDGVGKTTLVGALAERLGGLATSTPGPALRRVSQDVLAALGDEQTARCLFYSASVLSQGRAARRLADEGKLVVMDRYWGSTIAYARARGVGVDLSTLESIVPRADVTLLLALDEGVRRRRLSERSCTTAADIETFDERFREVVLAELRPRCTSEIDLTGASVDQAVECLRQVIDRASTIGAIRG